MLFWIVIIALTLLVALPLALSLARGGGEPRGAEGENPDVALYAAQLAELHRDQARGVVTPEDAARARTEISRRILDADRAGRGATEAGVPRGATLAALALVAAAFLGGGAFYLWEGAPGYEDQPLALRLTEAEALRAARPDQAAAEQAAAGRLPPPATPDPQLAQLLTQLRAALQKTPDDPQGLALLAENEQRLGNFAAARAAQEHLVEVKGDAASVTDLATLAHLMISAADSTVTPQAEAVLDKVLRRDPENAVALFYKGLAQTQINRPDLAFATWDGLLRQSPPDAPWVAPISRALPDLAWFAGRTDYQLPGAGPMAGGMPGPDGAAMAAAGDMTDEERQAMIQGMVDRLGARLETEGGSPEEWARYINALGVLGKTDEARAAWTRAQAALAGDDAGLATARAAAEQAGVAE